MDDATFERLTNKIHRVRIERQLAMQQHELELQKQQQVLSEQRQRYNEKMSSFSSIRHYSPYIGSNTIHVPVKVIVLQSKYLAQMHRTCVTLKQFTLMEEQASKLVANLRSDRLEFLQDHAQLLSQIVESISESEADRKQLQESCQSLLDLQAEMLKDLKGEKTKLTMKEEVSNNTLSIIEDEPNTSPRSSTAMIEPTVEQINKVQEASFHASMAERGEAEIFSPPTVNEITAQ
mmetsp:Transcript_26144/g.39567  ORF Transcript_26144/g.39567 Transcript_26144/m.39567 type:complete len:234 (+) Transcript_26144:153-854(+)